METKPNPEAKDESHAARPRKTAAKPKARPKKKARTASAKHKKAGARSAAGPVEREL